MSISKAFRQTVDKAKDNAGEVLDSLTPDDEPVGQKPQPVTRKALVIVFNPTISSEGGRKLSQVMGWNDTGKLISGYIPDVRECSFVYANYQVVETIEVDRFPVKLDGFAYTGDSFMKCIRSGAGFHQPDAVDYHRILADFDIIRRIDSGAIDEVWLFGFPYGGFYESIMPGPGAFWCNAPPLEKTDHCSRRFVIMGYNYERGVGEMLENLGHRAESIMKHVFRNKRGDDNLWERFARYDKTHPGQAEVGIVHYAPNSTKDYEWGRRARVKSRHHVWQKFPDLDGNPLEVDSDEWGKGDTREHHLWWFRHFPHITGSSGGVGYNWWRYVVDPNTVR